MVVSQKMVLDKDVVHNSPQTGSDIPYGYLITAATGMTLGVCQHNTILIIFGKNMKKTYQIKSSYIYLRQRKQKQNESYTTRKCVAKPNV